MKDDVIDELVPVNPEDYVPDPGERRDKYVRGMKERVSGLVRRCGRAVDKLWEKALDKDVAYEELREVVRVVDGLARLAIAAADVRGGGGEAPPMYDVGCTMDDLRNSRAEARVDDFPAGGGCCRGSNE